MAYLSVENVYKSFGSTEVLKGINFTLNKGQVLSIIGLVPLNSKIILYPPFYLLYTCFLVNSNKLSFEKPSI